MTLLSLKNQIGNLVSKQLLSYSTFFALLLCFASSAHAQSQKSSVIPAQPFFYEEIPNFLEGTSLDMGGMISVIPHVVCELNSVPTPVPSTCVSTSSSSGFIPQTLSAGLLNEATQVFIELSGPPAITPYDLTPHIGEFGIIHSETVQLSASPYQFYEAISTHKVTFDTLTPGTSGTVTNGEEVRLTYTHNIGSPQSVTTAISTVNEPLLSTSSSLSFTDHSATVGQPVFTISQPEFPNSIGAATPGTARLGQVNYDGDEGDRRMGELTFVKLPTGYSAAELDNREYKLSGYIKLARPDGKLGRCLTEGFIAFDTNNSNGGSVALLSLTCITVDLTDNVQGTNTLFSTALTVAQEQILSADVTVGTDGSIDFSFTDLINLPIDSLGNLTVGLGPNFRVSGFVQEGSNLIVLKAVADNSGDPTIASAAGLLYATRANF